MLAMPFEWASVQMPLNVMDVHYRSFQKGVLPILVQRNIGVLAMKSLGGNGSIVTKAGVPVEQALRYVLSLPISSLVSGIDSEKVLDQNLKIVREFQADAARGARRDRGEDPDRGRRRSVRAVQVVEDVRRPRASQAARVRYAG